MPTDTLCPKAQEPARQLGRDSRLYVPDSLLNCGALIRGTIFHLEGRREPVSNIGERVGTASARILQRAESEDAAPLRVAVREAEERIAAWHSE